MNKVSTKVALSFSIKTSTALTEREKQRLLLKLGNRLTNDGILVLHCDESRSQYRNKAQVTDRLLEILEAGLKVRKKRQKTKPTKSSIEKRLRQKKNRAQKKVNRGKPNLE